MNFNNHFCQQYGYFLPKQISEHQVKFVQNPETHCIFQEVKNLIGARDYFFGLTIEGNEPNTTTTMPTTTTDKPSTTSGPPEPEVIHLIISTNHVWVYFLAIFITNSACACFDWAVKILIFWLPGKK
jgi:hypothetical protein